MRAAFVDPVEEGVSHEELPARLSRRGIHPWLQRRQRGVVELVHVVAVIVQRRPCANSGFLDLLAERFLVHEIRMILLEIMRWAVNEEGAGLCQKLQKAGVWRRPFNDNRVFVREAHFREHTIHIEVLWRAGGAELIVQRNAFPVVLEIL